MVAIGEWGQDEEELLTSLQALEAAALQEIDLLSETSASDRPAFSTRVAAIKERQTHMRAQLRELELLAEEQET
jgi:hypothetical protein